MNFIFIVGPSAVRKTTLVKKLFKYYKGVYIEQNMISEFFISANLMILDYLRKRFVGKIY